MLRFEGRYSSFHMRLQHIQCRNDTTAVDRPFAGNVSVDGEECASDLRELRRLEGEVPVSGSLQVAARNRPFVEEGFVRWVRMACDLLDCRRYMAVRNNGIFKIWQSES